MNRTICVFCLLKVLLCGCTTHPVTAETRLNSETAVPTTEAQVPTTQPPYVYDQNLNWDTLPVYDFPERCSFAHSNIWLDGEDYIPMNREEALAFLGVHLDLEQVLNGAQIDNEGLNYGVYYTESKGYYNTENRFQYTFREGGSITMVVSHQKVMEIFSQEVYESPDYGVINGCNVLLGLHEGENREIYAQLTMGGVNVLLRFRNVQEADVLAVLDYLTMQNK